jgi:hypothetical protein
MEHVNAAQVELSIAQQQVLAQLASLRWPTVLHALLPQQLQLVVFAQLDFM